MNKVIKNNEVENDRKKPNFLISLIFGFVGGIISTILIFSIFIFDKSLNIFQHILNWPFLLFVITFLIILIFHEQIKLLFSKGEFKFKWGDREISISDIPEKIDQEISSKLDDIQVTDEENRKESKTILAENFSEDILSSIKER